MKDQIDRADEVIAKLHNKERPNRSKRMCVGIASLQTRDRGIRLAETPSFRNKEVPTHVFRADGVKNVVMLRRAESRAVIEQHWMGGDYDMFIPCHPRSPRVTKMADNKS